MTKYLISFPAEAMNLEESELAAARADSHEVIEQAKAAGVYVFGGGVNESAGTVVVAADGVVNEDTYPGVSITGGFLVLDLPTRADAVDWAARIAAACRCPQELREFGYDPAS